MSLFYKRNGYYFLPPGDSMSSRYVLQRFNGENYHKCQKLKNFVCIGLLNHENAENLLNNFEHKSCENSSYFLAETSLPTNIRVGLKGLPFTNILAYLAHW